MINPFADVQWKPDLAERRKFAKSLIIGFPCLAVAFLIMGWVSKGSWDANWKFARSVGAFGALAGVIFFAVPQIARPFYMAWYFLACCIGIVVGNLLLSGFFFLVITPFGLLRRLVARAPAVQKKFDRNSKSYWQDFPPVSNPERYYRQF